VCRSKHVEPSINYGIINSITKLHLVGISTESYYDARIHEYQIYKRQIAVSCTKYWLPFVKCFTGLESNLRTAVTTQNTTECNFISSHAQNTTERQTNIFLSWVNRLLFQNMGGAVFPSPNNCQGQLKTPQSLFVFLFAANLN
jgi:hypothetical protein